MSKKSEQINELAAIIAAAQYDAWFEQQASNAENAGVEIVERWWTDLEPGEQKWRTNEHRAAAIAVLQAGWQPTPSHGDGDPTEGQQR